MKFVYPAGFHKSEKGGYEGYFPDLWPAARQRARLWTRQKMPTRQLSDWINLELRGRGKSSPVSEVSDLELKEGDIVRNIQVTIKFMEGWEE